MKTIFITLAKKGLKNLKKVLMTLKFTYMYVYLFFISVINF